MTLFKYIINPSPIGEITIIWRKKPQFQIEEIILSNPNKTSSQIAKEKYEKEAIIPKSHILQNVFFKDGKYIVLKSLWN